MAEDDLGGPGPVRRPFEELVSYPSLEEISIITLSESMEHLILSNKTHQRVDTQPGVRVEWH